MEVQGDHYAGSDEIEYWGGGVVEDTRKKRGEEVERGGLRCKCNYACKFNQASRLNTLHVRTVLDP